MLRCAILAALGLLAYHFYGHKFHNRRANGMLMLWQNLASCEAMGTVTKYVEDPKGKLWNRLFLNILSLENAQGKQ